MESLRHATPCLTQKKLALLNTGMIEADMGTRRNGDTAIIVDPLRSNHPAIMQCQKIK